jgi:hypothetical protein
MKIISKLGDHFMIVADEKECRALVEAGKILKENAANHGCNCDVADDL